MRMPVSQFLLEVVGRVIGKPSNTAFHTILAKDLTDGCGTSATAVAAATKVPAFFSFSSCLCRVFVFYLRVFLKKKKKKLNSTLLGS
jgi:hypothetical protein